MAELFRNAKSDAPAMFSASREPLVFHRKLPGYAPTPLVDCPKLASRLGVGRLLIKSEISRLGLPAFKILGASWATYRCLVERLGHEPQWRTVDDLKNAFAPLRPLQLIAATDGNHGRAVARMANWLGLECRIFVPQQTARARIEAIEGEGASVAIVAGSYDDAVARSAAEASDRCLAISDTSWPGYVDPPQWVIEGYGTIFAEIDDELTAQGWPAPTIAFLPAGVGAFAASAVAHFRGAGRQTTLVTVEPSDAACVLESLRARKLVDVPGPHRSMMAGLNCGQTSLLAFPVLQSGIDYALSIDDESAAQAMRLLAAANLEAGETGAASLAGALGILDRGSRATVGLDASATVLCFITEGVTDPVNYERIVGKHGTSG